MSNILDLSSFKSSRPHLIPLLDWFEKATDPRSFIDFKPINENLPYPEDLVRNQTPTLPFMLINKQSSDYIECIKLCIDYCDNYHKTFDSQAFNEILINKFPEIGRKLSSNGYDHDQSVTFLASQSIKMLHIAVHGQPVQYHTDLFNLLIKTQITKSCNVPVTSLKLPFESIYLDWKNSPIKSPKGYSSIGMYIHKTAIEFEMLKKSGMLESDPSLKRSYDLGCIREGYPVTTLELLLVNKPSDEFSNPEVILFPIMYSECSEISLHQAIISHREQDADWGENFTFNDLSVPISLAISSLLYMISSDSYREEIKEASDFKKKIKGLRNPAKKRKAESRLNREYYDFVRIGHQYQLSGEHSNSGAHGSKETHVRTGYFNIYYTGNRVRRDENGKIMKDASGKSIPIPKEERDSEVKWIMPKIINEKSGPVVNRTRKLQ